MQRLFYKELENWYKNSRRYPMLVVGARQVGKTYIITKFCKDYFKNVISINLMKDKDLINIFKEDYSFENKVALFETVLGQKISGEDTVLFVDEVQESEDFIESLKFFNESDETYNIICAGSLLGVTLSRFTKSFPVGKVIKKEMFPLNFEEFLIVTNNERYIPLIKKSYETNEKLPYIIHETLLNLFHIYLFLGGMPEVIQDYINNNGDLVKTNKDIIEKIVNSYIDDMGKYVSTSKESLRIKAIYSDIPSQLAKENQKFIFANLETKDSRKRDYITAIDWLINSKLVLKCNMLTTPLFPINGYVDKDSYKLYLNDPGIMNYFLKVPASAFLLDMDYSYKGVVTENYVASELSKNNNKLFYWSRKGKNKGNAEIDFILQQDIDVIPIEVKSSNNVQAKSLNVYVETFKPKYAIRISSKNFGFENNIKSIPLYAVFCIKSDV